MKTWPFLYSVPPEGGVKRNDVLLSEPAHESADSTTAPATLRGDLVARGIKTSSPVPKRLKAKAQPA